MSWIFKNEPSSPSDSRTLRQRALLLSLPFALMGVFALVLLLHDGLGGGLTKPKAIQLLSVVIVCAGFPILILGIAAKKNALNAAKLKSGNPESPGKPWLQREDWAAGRIKSAGLADARSSLIMGFALCAIGGLIAGLVIPRELSNGNQGALLVLIFPLAGALFLTAVVRKILAHRQYGDCFFEMTTTPGVLGGTLEGVIQTSVHLQFKHGLNLKLGCIRCAGSGRNNAEKVLWQDEQVVTAATSGPETGSGRNGIPVCFRLPGNQPESSSRGKEPVIWRLEAKAKMAGLFFDAKFEVPVFKLPGSAAPANGPKI
jgi:hypothetical protein